MNKIKNALVDIGEKIRYVTPLKAYNYLLLRKEYKQEKIKLRGFPIAYYIDICNICNLKCPLCPTGNGSDKRKKQTMTFETYKQIFDKIKKYSFYVNLYNWGEPFLNKDIFKIIEYTKKNRVGVVLSTNFNIVNAAMVKSIVDLRVDKIVLSIDGSNPESYNAYRKNGDFNIVLSNLRKLVLQKKLQNSIYPKIVWQYLVNKKNEKFVDKAIRLAEDIGVNISFPKFQISQEILKKGRIINKRVVDEWIPNNLKSDINNYVFRLQAPCAYLYYYMTINPEGTTSPCCAIYDSNTDFGDLLKDDLKNVWNNENYLSARSLFSKNQRPKKKTICEQCATIIYNNDTVRDK